MTARLAEPCICMMGPSFEGPDETCPEHGRPYSYWVEGYEAKVVADRALRDRIQQLADAYLKSWRLHAGASTLDTDVAQMLRNLGDRS